ncbi:hypothetical protein [Streptomyces sp. ODS28]|uniref:hypothetical protein n=1 Tax=Streptomyces sp. ODS28 TaxID=3136688 RepID=UPI0031EA0D87
MKRSTHIAGGVVAATTAGAMLLTIAPAAQASDGPSRTERAARTVESATGTHDLAATTSAQDAAAVARTERDGRTGVAKAPRNAAGEVRIVAHDGSTAGLGLPESRTVDGSRSDTGTVVYPDAAQSTDIAVQLTGDGGARALTTLKDSAAPTQQRYELNLPAGTEAVANEDGGYDLVRKADGDKTGDGKTGHGKAGDDQPAVTVGTIEAPWAKDANGKKVHTSYRLEGDTLVQQVDTTKDTAFPVVADPQFKWGIITGTLYFNKSETNKAALGGGFLAAAAGMIPGIGAPSSITLAGWTTMANIAKSHNKCLKINTWLKPDEYKGGYCR